MNLLRMVLSYVPARWTTILVSISLVVIFTRYLDPAEFGRYALVMATIHLFDSCFLGWIRQSQLRFFQNASADGKLYVHLSTAYFMYFAVAAVLALVLCLAALYLPIGEALREPMLAGVVLFVAWGFVRQGLELYRAGARIKRYSVVECARALTGLVAALILVVVFDLREVGLLLGLAAGAAAIAAVDGYHILSRISLRLFSIEDLKKFAHYGIPLTATFALTFLMTTSNRFLIEYFMGSEAVGLYSAGYGVAQQTISSLFMLVSTAAFPLALKRYQQGGMAAVQSQILENGTLMLGLGVPAVAGLVILAVPITEIALGEPFRQTGAQIIPWIAFSNFLVCVKSFYFDQGFQLARRTSMIVWINLPPAVSNIVLSVLLIPIYGIMGAVYATAISFGLALALSILVGRRVFTIPVPWQASLRVGLATCAMVAILLLLSFPPGWFGLVLQIALGVAVYGSCVVIFNVGDSRGYCLKTVAKLRA